MKTNHLIAALIVSVSLLCANFATAQGQRKDYVSDPSHIVGTYQPAVTDHSPKAMAAAAQAFIDALDDEQRARAAVDLRHRERRLWTNLPPRAGAGGLRMGDLNEQQVKRACDLIRALFSEAGYNKICHIMLADDQLLRNGQRRQGFGTVDFSFVVFGKPSATKPWAVQIDGHHIGVNVALHGDKFTLSPSFIGTQPQTFKIAGKSYRPFTGEIDDAYKLAGSLSAEQRQAAVINPRRGRITTGPGKDNHVPQPRGVACSTFTNDQKKLLLRLVGQWINDLPPAHAAKRTRQITADVDKVHFAWFGDIAANSEASYIIQGPTVIIEYASQGNQDHLHSMYRDPTNEYGGQLAGE